MSVSYIPEKTKLLLWGKACGRCQYDGCNDVLWRDPLTQAEFNTAYIAHIIADQPKGPRGHPTLSEKLKSDLSNLMLLCDVHHRRIDKDDVTGHPVELLQKMKHKHEERMEQLTSINPNKQSHVLLYGAKIGNIDGFLNSKEAELGMIPDWYPASPTPLVLSLQNTSWNDRDRNFWEIEEPHLVRQFSRNIEPRFNDESVHHISVFAFAPQPLLIKLGTLLTDIRNVEVYQRQREPQTWKWQTSPNEFEYIIKAPEKHHAKVALNMSLSATIDDARITNVLGDGVSIWTITIKEPHNNHLRSRDQLKLFREKMRLLLDQIKSTHGQKAELHVFPAIPVATSVELGRVWQPKADMRMHIYDQNTANGGFAHALTIGS